MSNLIFSLKKKLNATEIDINLLNLYENSNGNKLTEFNEDFNKISKLRKAIKQHISKGNVQFLVIYNLFVLIKNVFGSQSLSYIAVEYFSESEAVYEHFCSLVYYFFDIKISNRMSRNFLFWLESNDTRK